MFLDVLLEHGANILQKTSSGKTLLYLVPSSSISFEFLEDLFESTQFTSLEYMLNKPTGDHEYEYLQKRFKYILY